MKQFRKALLLVLMALALIFCFAACGEEDEPTDTGKTDNTTPPTIDPPVQVIGEINVSGVTFGGRTAKLIITADGEYHLMESDYLKGTTTPERTTVRFEYWNADETVKVADGGVGVKDPGTYIVRAIFSYEGGQYSENYVKATLIIDQSYAIIYHMPDGAVKDDANPEIYSLSSEELMLGSAALENYKFKGWYTTSDYSGDPVTMLSNFQTGGDIDLWARFQPYCAYPTPYEYTTTVTEAPTSLPPIPGFDSVTEDSVCIVDMSAFTNVEDTESMNSFGFRYGNPTSDLNGIGFKEAALSDGNGGYGLRWNMYHPADAVIPGQYASIMQFTAPVSTGYDLANYDTLEFWVYSANATDQVFTVFLITGGDGSKSMTFNVSLNYSGWKKFSVLMAGSSVDLNAPAGISGNITEIRFLGTPNDLLRSKAANLCTEEMNDVVNFIYFSNIYVTNHKSNYPVSTSTSQNDLIAVTSNLQSLTLSATKNDSEIAAYLAAMALDAAGTAVPSDATYVFSDLTAPGGTALYKAIYERLFYMAEAWNDTGSSFYQSEDLLNAVVAGMNFMADGMNAYVIDNLPPLSQDMTDCCLYIADVMNIIGDHLSEKHAQAWGQLPLRYFPSACGDGVDAFNSAYIYSSIQLGLRNAREAITGLKQLNHVFTARELILTSTDAKISRYMALVVAMKGTNLNPVAKTYIDDLFAWFYDCVDAFTVNGKLPDVIASQYDLVPYLRAMFLIYDLADPYTQNIFASYVKLYLASDSTLASRLAAAQYYDLEGEVLAAIQASDVAALVPATTTIKVYDTLGSAIYKTEDAYLVITPDGIIATGIDASGIAVKPSDSTFYGLANEEMLSIIRGDEMIVVYNGSIVVKESLNAVLGDETNTAAILPVVNTAVGDDLLDSTSAPVMILIHKNDDGSLTFTVYNYTRVSVDFDFYLNGYYMLNGLLETVMVAPDYNSIDPLTCVTIIASSSDSLVYTFTIYPMG